MGKFNKCQRVINQQRRFTQHNSPQCHKCITKAQRGRPKQTRMTLNTIESYCHPQWQLPDRKMCLIPHLAPLTALSCSIVNPTKRSLQRAMKAISRRSYLFSTHPLTHKHTASHWRIRPFLSSSSLLYILHGSDCSFFRTGAYGADGCEFKVSWSLAEVMEGYLWLYIFGLAGLPWRWRIKHRSCLSARMMQCSARRHDSIT